MTDCPSVIAIEDAGEIECEDIDGHKSRHHAAGIDGDCVWRLEWERRADSEPYQININGHSTQKHNDQVKAIAEDAARKLKALPGATGVHLSGYSNDGAEKIDLTTPAD